jgi:hypothetical protein
LFEYETEEKIKKVAVTTLGYAWKQENKEWFVEECTTVIEKKNCPRPRTIQIQNRTIASRLTSMNKYRQAEIKKRQLDDQPLIEIKQHHSVQDSRKFYKRLNDTRKPFEPVVTMCQATNGHLLTNKDQVLWRWKNNI